MSVAAMFDPTQHDLRATPLSDALGAEVSGLDLRKPLEKAHFQNIKALLAHHLVLLFRDQDLSPAQQIAFSARFGPVQSHPPGRRQGLPGYPEILLITPDTESPAFPSGTWLSDLSYTRQPLSCAIAHARAATAGQGDFLFASQQGAFDRLSPGLQELLSGLKAHHVAAPRQATPRQTADSRGHAGTSHPAVLRHPETGRAGLYVNPAYTHRLGDLSPAESAPLLAHLRAVATVPENTYRHRWRPGDVVLWDCRACLRYALPVPPGSETTEAAGAAPYELRQTTVAGGRPA